MSTMSGARTIERRVISWHSLMCSANFRFLINWEIVPTSPSTMNFKWRSKVSSKLCLSSAKSNLQEAFCLSAKNCKATVVTDYAGNFSISSRRDNRKLASHNVAGNTPTNHRVLKGRWKTFAQFHRALRHENYFFRADQPLRSWLISIRRVATWRLCTFALKKSAFNPCFIRG